MVANAASVGTMSKHRLLGIISGVGSMMVPALDEDLRKKIEVVGNYEWRKYYNTGTFEHNFQADTWPAWGDVPEDAKQNIDIVMSHPECGNFSVLQKDLSKGSQISYSTSSWQSP